MRGKTEILQIIGKLIENQAQDVFELLADVYGFLKLLTIFLAI